MAEQALRLRLYIAGSSPNSRKAVANLALLRASLPDAALSLELVDVFQNPARALADGILLTPQLMILSGGDARMVVGDLSDRAALLSALALEPP
jgi:circadian clock protein KaiB